MRTKPSRKVVTRESVAEAVFDKVQVESLSLRRHPDGKVSLQAMFGLTDGSESLPGHEVSITMGDISEIEAAHPQFAAALDSMNDLAHKYYRLQSIQDEMAEEKDQNKLDELHAELLEINAGLEAPLP